MQAAARSPDLRRLLAGAGARRDPRRSSTPTVPTLLGRAGNGIRRTSTARSRRIRALRAGRHRQRPEPPRARPVAARRRERRRLDARARSTSTRDTVAPVPPRHADAVPRRQSEDRRQARRPAAASSPSRPGRTAGSAAELAGCERARNAGASSADTPRSGTAAPAAARHTTTMSPIPPSPSPIACARSARPMRRELDVAASGWSTTSARSATAPTC